MNEIINKKLITEIKSVLTLARKNVAQKVNNELLNTYWKIGRLIVEEEMNGDKRAEYGRQIIDSISKELTNEFGKGFSRSGLFSMRAFYLMKPNVQTVSGQLSWSHYCELLSVSDEKARSFYEIEAANSNWSVRELRRQIDSSLFERLLLSTGKDNKKKLMELSTKGLIINEPSDIIKDPYVFEFLGIPENKPMLESNLEAMLIEKLKEFLLELGKGFMFVGSQQRITLGNIHYYVDLVFYNKLLRTYVLIDLNTGTLKPENAGQMNMYLNYYEREVNDEGDEKPIGIILCAGKDEIVAEYSFEGLSSNIYASKYTYVLPKKENLIEELNKALKEQEEN